MAEARTAARPYAEAAFEVAKDRGTLAEWSQMLALLASLVSDERVARLATDPRVGRDRLVEFVLGLVGTKLDADSGDVQGRTSVAGDSMSGATNFVRLLIDNHRLPLAPEIARIYEELRAEAEGRVDVVIKTAYELTPEQRALLETGLKRRFGRKITLNVNVDPSLIAGIEIRAGDTVIDGTVKGRLQALAAQLNQP